MKESISNFLYFLFKLSFIQTIMELLFLQQKINTIQNNLAKINQTIANINTFSKKLQFSKIMKINSVCFIDLTLYHTSQIMVSLGQDYFLQTTKDHALEIANRRKASQQSELKKAKQLKDKIDCKNGVKNEKKEKKEGNEQKKKSEKILIQKNEEGEEVFQIIEYADEQQQEQSNKKRIKQEQNKQIRKQVEKQVKMCEGQRMEKQKKEQIEKKQSVEVVKKVSKFKQQRMKQKGLI